MSLRPPLLFERLSTALPFRFGAALLPTFLFLAGYHVMTLGLPAEIARYGLRINYLTLPGQFLPDRLLDSDALFLSAKLVFLIAAAFWIMHRALPLSPWIAALSLMLVVSMNLERMYYTRHTVHAVNNMLFILAAWYQADYVRLRHAFRRRDWNAPLLPLWVVELGVLWAVITYAYSGWFKLLKSGPAWASGTPLQLWAFEWGVPGFFTDLVIDNRAFAFGLQAGVFAAELTCIICLWFEKIRPVYGIVFVGFHIGSVLLFGSTFDFYGNIALALFLFVLAPFASPYAKPREIR